MNDSMHDRESAFAAGEYDFWSRATLFGGWEIVTTNIDPDKTLASSANLPRQTARRGFGGVRLRLGTRSNVTVRIEEGGRIARPVLGGLDSRERHRREIAGMAGARRSDDHLCAGRTAAEHRQPAARLHLHAG